MSFALQHFSPAMLMRSYILILLFGCIIGAFGSKKAHSLHQCHLFRVPKTGELEPIKCYIDDKTSVKVLISTESGSMTVQLKGVRFISWLGSSHSLTVSVLQSDERESPKGKITCETRVCTGTIRTEGNYFDWNGCIAVWIEIEKLFSDSGKGITTNLPKDIAFQQLPKDYSLRELRRQDFIEAELFSLESYLIPISKTKMDAEFEIDFDPLYKMTYTLSVSVERIQKEIAQIGYIVSVRLEGFEKGWHSNFTAAVIGLDDFHTMEYGTKADIDAIYKNSVYKKKFQIFKDPFDGNGVMHLQVGMVGRQKWGGRIHIEHKAQTSSTDPDKQTLAFTVPVIRNNQELPFTEVEAFGQIFTVRIVGLGQSYTIYLDEFPSVLKSTATFSYMKRVRVLSRDTFSKTTSSETGEEKIHIEEMETSKIVDRKHEDKNRPFKCEKADHSDHCYVHFDLNSKKASTFDLQIKIKKSHSVRQMLQGLKNEFLP